MSKKVKLSKVATTGLFAALAAGQSLGLPTEWVSIIEGVGRSRWSWMVVVDFELFRATIRVASVPQAQRPGERVEAHWGYLAPHPGCSISSLPGLRVYVFTGGYEALLPPVREVFGVHSTIQDALRGLWPVAAATIGDLASLETADVSITRRVCRNPMEFTVAVRPKENTLLNLRVVENPDYTGVSVGDNKVTGVLTERRTLRGKRREIFYFQRKGDQGWCQTDMYGRPGRY